MAQTTYLQHLLHKSLSSRANCIAEYVAQKVQTVQQPLFRKVVVHNCCGKASLNRLVYTLNCLFQAPCLLARGTRASILMFVATRTNQPGYLRYLRKSPPRRIGDLSRLSHGALTDSLAITQNSSTLHK